MQHKMQSRLYTRDNQERWWPVGSHRNEGEEDTSCPGCLISSLARFRQIVAYNFVFKNNIYVRDNIGPLAFAYNSVTHNINIKAIWTVIYLIWMNKIQ